MAERKTKVTPAAQAGDEVKQDPATQGEPAPVNDPAAANALVVTDPVPDGDGPVKDEAVLQDEPVPPEPEAAETMAGLFEPDAIEVVAKCERFRRAGRVFSREPVTIPLAELNEAQLAQLCHEPMLVVQLTRTGQED